MKNECQEILKNCQIWSLNKSFNTMKQPFGAKITVTGPRQIYALDICTVDTQAKEIDTDLPTSFLIITDAWSLYTICVPINANATCREILEKFSRHIIQPFGIPKIGITTDGGKNFSCKLSNTFTAVLSLQQFRISPFNARSNPAERDNRAILSGLRYASQQFHLEPEVFKNYSITLCCLGTQLHYLALNSVHMNYSLAHHMSQHASQVLLQYMKQTELIMETLYPL
jgi:hypothetical protein